MLDRKKVAKKRLHNESPSEALCLQCEVRGDPGTLSTVCGRVQKCTLP